LNLFVETLADRARRLIGRSTPNYVTLEAGDNLGLTNGAWLPGSAHSQSTTDHLTTYLKNKGITWKAYSENLPGNGSILPLFDGPGYSLDHNPFVYFYDVTANPPSTNSAYGITHVRPYETEFARDLTSNNVASYNFIVPTTTIRGKNWRRHSTIWSGKPTPGSPMKSQKSWPHPPIPTAE